MLIYYQIIFYFVTKECNTIRATQDETADSHEFFAKNEIAKGQCARPVYEIKNKHLSGCFSIENHMVSSTVAWKKAVVSRVIYYLLEF